MKFLVTCIAFAFLISCASKNNKVTSSDGETVSTSMATDTLLQVKRGGCFGQCPMDRTTILNNGDVTYFGKKFVDNLGDHSTKISMKSVAQIKKGLSDANFFQLAERYPIDQKNKIMDLPTVTITGYQGDQSHTVSNTHDAPRELKDFQKLIVGIINELEINK